MGEGLLEFMLKYPIDRYRDSANVLIELFGKMPNVEDMITALEARIEALKDGGLTGSCNTVGAGPRSRVF